jgi:hypothetical protein
MESFTGRNTREEFVGDEEDLYLLPSMIVFYISF